jgi:glucokinase
MNGPGVALAIDIGGTKFAAGLVDRDGNLSWRDQVATPVSSDPEQLWDRLAELVKRAPVVACQVCGIGSGGPMTSSGALISPLNIPAWRDFPLRERIARLTGLPAYVDNDAKALALGEGWTGATKGLANYMAMVVSTGVGGGIVLDGRLLDGISGNAGHIGHMIVEPGGHPCVCGAVGCLEAEASGPSIARITGRPPAEAGPDVVARTGRLVGRAVASVCNLLDLRVTAVAGSVALGFGRPFFAAAQRELDESCRLPFSRGARIVPGALGADGPLVGAAAVGWRGLLGEVAPCPT